MIKTSPARKRKPVELTPAYKWLPVPSDYCTGCGKCVKACPHACLGLVWDFAKLEHPENCVSEGDCVEVCPHDGIKMEWVKTTASRDTGTWRDDPPPRSDPGTLLSRLLDGIRRRLQRAAGG